MVGGFTTTKVNPGHCKVYSIQLYVIKLVSDLWLVGDLFGYSRFSTNKTDRHDINEIVFKEVLDIITITSIGYQ
jgi:hypothetical protein